MLTETARCKIIWKDMTGCNFCSSVWRKGKSVTRFTTQSLISGNYLLTQHCKYTQRYKCWQNPCLFPEELGTLVNHLKSVFALSSTTKAEGDREHSLWQLKAVSISSQSFPPITISSLGKKNKFGFPEANRMPALYLSCWSALEVAVLV